MTASADVYATGHVRTQIENALLAARSGTSAVTPGDLAPLEDFHTLGRFATVGLVTQAQITRDDRVLDAGSGIGGTARYVAHEVGARVTAVDLSPEYCAVASWLNDLVGLSGRIETLRADVCALPLPDGQFDVALTQHVQMNVADKVAFYRELRRVLTPGGRLALWEIVAGNGAPLAFPVPWATRPTESHLVSAAGLRGLVEDSGFGVTVWEDATAASLELVKAFLAQPPGPLGLHVFVPEFLRKAGNLVDNLDNGRVRLIRAVAVAL